MSAYKEITKELSTLTSLQQLTGTYAQLAALRMKATREGVLTTRTFMESINGVFETALREYFAHHRGTADRVTFVPHNGKTVAVFVSANTGLHGSAVSSTFDLFVSELADTTEVTIVGSFGVGLFTKRYPNRPYTHFAFPDNAIDEGKLIQLIGHIVQYEAVHMYYPQFHSVVRQQPTKRIISASPHEPHATTVVARYLYEPSIADILMFFEEELFASLVDTVMRESQLAKFASRIIAMDSASERIKDRSRTMQLARLVALHEDSNRKQLNMMGSIMRGRR